MHEGIKALLKRYSCNAVEEYRHALKEIIQEIALLGLWRAKFFENTAFYGGTALRLLHGLDRFSEDLDFSLVNKDEFFKLDGYIHAVKQELLAFGFAVEVQVKEKTKDSVVQSAFIKANTLEHLLSIKMPAALGKGIHKDDLLRVRFEVDTDPPGTYPCEAKFLLLPIPFSVRTFTLPHLFAGKMHAALFREWKSRVKGRDWYDLIWFLARNVPLALSHFEDCMRQAGTLHGDAKLSESQFMEIYQKRVQTLDIDLAKKDVMPFVRDTESLNIWSKAFFSDIIRSLTFV